MWPEVTWIRTSLARMCRRVETLLVVVRQVPRTVHLIWRAHPTAAIAVPIVGILAGPLPVLNLYCLKRMLDAVGAVSPGRSADALPTIALFLFLFIAVLVVSRSLSALGQFLQQILEAKLRYHVLDQLSQTSLQLDMAFFETPEFHDKLRRAEQEVGYRPIRIVSTATSGIRLLVEILGCLITLTAFAWWTSAYVLLIAVPMFYVQARFGHLGWAIVYGRTPEERRMRYYLSLMTSENEAKDVRLFVLGQYLTQRWRELFASFYRQDVQLALKRAVAELAAVLAQTVSYGAFYGFVVWRVLSDPLVTIGGLIMYTQLMERALQSTSDFLRGFGGIYEDSLYLSNLFDYLDQRPTIVCPRDPTPVPRQVRYGIRMEGVTFRYPRAKVDVLRDISLEIPAGERVAFVGENGSGKTTIVKLLTRLYDPQVGRITVDGLDLRQLDPGEWHAKLGVILQDFGRYAVTARENIGFGCIRQLDNLHQIKDAARECGIDQCIERLPRGWETLLGKEFEEGHELSVGEWQKIALGRVFMRQAEILVLDEPTASMDPKQEYEIFRRFRELTKGKTTILISHRLSSVRMADRIYFIDAGRVAERGSHEELMDMKGRYAELFMRQAAGYQPC